ncbi:MAG: hypothetical protein HQL20_02965 [Candidatus Omnitrophica bacterium]|nr:hypothetical protein [Candidatus Omnitrophota bacterium]
MSIFWDPRGRKPQAWVYPFFIVLTIVLFMAIYNYGNSRAGNSDAPDAVEGAK